MSDFVLCSQKRELPAPLPVNYGIEAGSSTSEFMLLNRRPILSVYEAGQAAGAHPGGFPLMFNR